MRKNKRNYLIAAMVACLLGIFLVYKNSIGRYIDPWLSTENKYKGHMSYWVAVTGIAMIVTGILLSLMAFGKDSKANTEGDAHAKV